MQIAYRGRTAEDAKDVCDLLAAAGITAHIPDNQLGPGARGEVAEFRVLVDNHLLDRARRALVPWLDERRRDPSSEAQ